MLKDRRIMGRKIKQQDFKWKYKILVIIVVAVGIILGSYIWINSDGNYLRVEGIKVVGLISETGGRNVRVSYSFNEQNYSVVVGHTNRTLQDGESYIVFINKNEPTDCIVDFSTPIFDKSKFSTAKTMTIRKDLLSDKVNFTYTVDGKSFERFQSISSNIDFDRSKEKITLLVNTLDPRIAYILFNNGLAN